MIDLSMTFEKMKEAIKFREYLVDEVISPKENPEYFSILHLQKVKLLMLRKVE